MQTLNRQRNEQLLRAAQQLAKIRKKSLSNMVERGLKRIIESAGDIQNPRHEMHWLEAFHKKYLKKDFKAPSDEEVKKIRTRLIQKYY